MNIEFKFGLGDASWHITAEVEPASTGCLSGPYDCAEAPCDAHVEAMAIRDTAGNEVDISDPVFNDLEAHLCQIAINLSEQEYAA